jgi:hypothetical protein
MQPKKQRLLLNRTFALAWFRRAVRDALQPLMRPVIVVILNIPLYKPTQLVVGKYDKVIQTFKAYGTYKPLRIGVHVRGIRHDTYIFNIVLLVGKPLKFP